MRPSQRRMMKDLRKAIRKMERNNLSSPRPPFLNGWLFWACGILLIALPGLIQLGDAISLVMWAGCLALSLGGRFFQWYYQRR